MPWTRTSLFKSLDDVLEGHWRIDLELDGASYWVTRNALSCFARRDECSLQSLICEDPGTSEARHRLNAREALCGRRSVAGIDRLNDSRQEGIYAALEHSITLIQGPPGTGKMEVASFLVSLMAELVSPVLVTAQTHTQQ